VEGQRTAVHAAGERVLVEQVAAHHLRAAGLQRRGRRVGASERRDLVPSRHQTFDERAADHAAAAGDEDAAHGEVRNAAENFSR
jgi:hypothetical protein